MQAWDGFCPICEANTSFEARYDWFRDHLVCKRCQTIPRERALMLTLRRLAPDWPDMAIHESSPHDRGVSKLLRGNCRGYVPTQFFPGVPLGTYHRGFRCEDIEQQTFADKVFDLVITQDVMEHVFDPAAAYREIHRTLRPGGLHIHTTPIYKENVSTEHCAEKCRDGTVRHMRQPEYHGNPVDAAGSLVTYRYGRDLPHLIAQWAPFGVEVHSFHDRHLGLIAEFLDVIVCRR